MSNGKSQDDEAYYQTILQAIKLMNKLMSIKQRSRLLGELADMELADLEMSVSVEKETTDGQKQATAAHNRIRIVTSEEVLSGTAEEVDAGNLVITCSPDVAKLLEKL